MLLVDPGYCGGHGDHHRHPDRHAQDGQSAARTLLARIESRAMADPSSIRESSAALACRLIRPSARRWDPGGRPGSQDTPRPRCPRSRPAPRPRRWTRAPPPPGKWGQRLDRRRPDAMPRPMPSAAPTAERVADSTTNWARMSRRRAPKRLANPDLAGPFAHRHQHDVHDHDPADHQRDRHQPGQGHEQHLARSSASCPALPPRSERRNCFSCPGFSCRRLRMIASVSAQGDLHLGRIGGLDDEGIQNVDGADQPPAWSAEGHDGELVQREPEEMCPVLPPRRSTR